MKLILLGPPGSGKGTQAQILQEKFGLSKISTGDILRNAVANETPLGLKAKPYMEKGELVPDELILQILKERLHEIKDRPGFVLDGVPRNLNQGKILEKMLKELHITLTGVVEIEVPLPVIIDRLTLRRSCEKCGSVYTLKSDPSSHPTACSRCGGKLIHRSDDTIPVIEKRLKIYQAETLPLIRFYKEKGLLIQINGSLPIPKVAEILHDCLKVKGRN